MACGLCWFLMVLLWFFCLQRFVSSLHIKAIELISPDIDQASVECILKDNVTVDIEWDNGKTLINGSLLLKDALNVIPDIETIIYTYKCTIYNKLECYNIYECRQKSSDITSRVKVHLEIEPPKKPFLTIVSVKQKSANLTWKPMGIGDIPSHMLKLRLNCNTSEPIHQNLPLKGYRKLENLKPYRNYSCKARLLFEDDKVLNIGAFTKTDMSFRTQAKRPVDLKPTLLIAPPLHGVHYVTCQVDFPENSNIGRLYGYRLRADQIAYGGEYDWGRLGFPPNNFQTKPILGPVAQYPFSDLTPWSNYSISCVAMNEDGLETQTNVQYIKVPESKPSKAPKMQLKIKSRNLIAIYVSMDRQGRNGVILNNYVTMISPKYQEIQRKPNMEREIVQFPKLRPYTNYTFYAQAETKVGRGPKSDVLRVLTDPDKPMKPEDVDYDENSHTLRLSWSPPKHPNGIIIDYTIRILLKNGTEFDLVAQTSQMEMFNTKCLTSEVFKVYVWARNSVGLSNDKASLLLDKDKSSKKQESQITPLVMVMIVIALFLFLVIIVILVVFYRRRRSAANNQILCYTKKESSHMESVRMWLRQGSASEDGDGAEQAPLAGSSKARSGSCEPIQIRTRDPIVANEFAEYINTSKQDDWAHLLHEFTQELQRGKLYPWQVAERPENKPKNRYADIAAYDHSRVLLRHDCKKVASDYINANYIQGWDANPKVPHQYISSQGPLDSTVNDFWLMVWQERVSNIVMLTNVVEKEQIKCAQYWPNEGSEKYGNITVTKSSIDKTADYLIRKFEVKKFEAEGVQTREVRQFHFISWPDHGVPEYPTSMLSLRRRVRHYMVDTNPILVHCSAGIGRSGCFILLDAMLERIDHEQSVDIFNYTQYLRTRRIHMVQTLEQYKLIHTAILEYITFGNTEIGGNIVGGMEKRVRERHGAAVTHEFEVLNRNTSREANGNLYRVHIKGKKSPDAFHVDGYKQRNAFIMSKSPSEDNVEDFWQTVFEHKCHTIVMLNRIDEDDEQEYFKYWPELEVSRSFGSFNVICTAQVTNGNIVTRKFKVSTETRTVDVHHFQFLDWSEGDILSSSERSHICTLMQAVQNSQQNLGNGPIVVHAGNGYGRSGTFVAIYNSTERLKVEQMVDVLQCVRSIRIAVPQAVKTAAQYKFVYNMILTYLEGFETYWNFQEPNPTRPVFA